MYKMLDYKYFDDITEKVSLLEKINRTIDYSKLEGNSLIKDEEILEFASTNNIEGDIVNLTTAKMFVKNEEKLNKKDLEKRWIGIKRASDLMWSDSFNVSPEFINEVHRALLREVDTPGGMYKTKINQVGSLITSHPDDVPGLMFNLYSSYAANSIYGGDVYLIIPFISEFLAIHPFEDGNGRMSRLLMNRLLFEAGFKFSKYISISKFLWDKKDEYIRALESRNGAWGSKSLTPADLVPLFNVILDSLILAAKKASEISKLDKMTFHDFKKEIKNINGPFSFRDIREFIKTSCSDATLKKWISEMVRESFLTKSGEKKSTKYQNNK